jgi:hypothetical protein
LPPFVSIGLSGHGEFGEMRFHSLIEIEELWKKVYGALEIMKDNNAKQKEQDELT